MRYRLITMLTLTAVLAVGAFGVASASATEPDFVPASGKFPVKFTLSGGGGLWRTAHAAIECESFSGEGEITGEKAVRKVVFVRHKCFVTVAGIKVECSNNSEQTLITSELLKGEPGYITPGVKGLEAVGLKLEGETGSVFAKFSCKRGGVEEKWTISSPLVGIATPINTLNNKFKLIYQTTGAVETPNTFEGATKQQLSSSLNGEPFELFGVEQEPTLTTAENVTLKG